MTRLSEMLSEAEQRANSLKKEKEKLERKLKEAEEVAKQAEMATAEV